ncbi:MAG: peptidylprolyl isomerase [Polyangiaceae bacterium]
MFKMITCMLGALVLAGCGSMSEGQAPTSPAAPPITPEGQCLAEAQSAGPFPATSPARVSVSHILVRHASSKRAPEGMTRSRGDACLRAEGALQALKQGRDFAELVAEFSDERGAKTRAGSIGSIEPEDVDPAFGAAAFSLEVNQVSNVVESRSGFHIILRTN